MTRAEDRAAFNVLDSPGSHENQGVRRAVRAVGTHLPFLPPPSLDLNPIEQVFAKLETLLRRAGERSVAAVRHRIGALLDHLSPAERGNDLRNSGYAPR